MPYRSSFSLEARDEDRFLEALARWYLRSSTPRPCVLELRLTPRSRRKSATDAPRWSRSGRALRLRRSVRPGRPSPREYSGDAVSGRSLYLLALDLTGYLACPHELTRAAFAALAPAPDRNARPAGQRKGEEHERAYLDRLRAAGRTVIEISLEPDHDWERAARETERAIDDRRRRRLPRRLPRPTGWRGIADFLERQPDGTYEAVDTKLARHAEAGSRAPALLLLRAAGADPGREPAELMHVELGSGERE